MADLKVPPSEIEVAEALDAIRAAGINIGPAWVIRRLAYQRDMLLQEIERDQHRKAVEAAVDKAGREMAEESFVLPTTLRSEK